MAINIKDGRRTVWAEPEWFPRPDGMERAVVFQPGYNSDPDPDPSRNYGVHGMEITWYLRGPNGVTQFTIFTHWVPGDLSPGHGLTPAGLMPDRTRRPVGADLGYHALVPQWDGQEDYGRDDCTFLPGGRCYYDGSGMAAEALAVEFTEKGEPAVWAALEERYAELKTGEE